MTTVLFVISLIAFVAMLALCFVGLARKKPKPDTRGALTRTRTWIGVAAAVWVIAGIASFAVPRDASPSADRDPADSAASRYEQTWSESYSDTTCSDWSSRMTDDQQFAAAADALVGIWSRIENSDRFPSDALIEEFQSGVTEVCVIPSMVLTDATVMLYQTEPRFTP